MSSVDDVRKLLQDLVTPDLKALDVRVGALEQKMDLKFTNLEQKFTHLEQNMDTKFTNFEQKMDMKFKHLEEKMELKADLSAATAASNHAAIMLALDLDRRMERLESDRLGEKRLDRPS